MKRIFITLICCLTLTSTDIQAKRKQISPNLFGIFFEDLNYAADGGLYAELIQNRSFEYSPSDINVKGKESPRNDWHYFTAWGLERQKSICTVSLETNAPIHPNNPHYLVVNVLTTGTEGAGIRNDGYDGIVLRKGEKYNFSIFLRMIDGEKMPVSIRLIDNKNKGNVLAETDIDVNSAEWQKYTASLVPSASTDNASLVVLFQDKGKIAVDMVSLFPSDTFKGRPNGMRRDLAETIAALKPSFMRFPGGCLAHGDGISNIYNWKNTIGPVEQRKEDRNIWDYHQSFGFGYFEYFQFCEDIGAKPIPVVAAGVSCQNSARCRGTGQEAIPMDQMPLYIQDILDLIEYCNGPVSSTWGSKRAEAGHPEPFNLEYIGIGNEDHITADFETRFQMITQTIKEKYPEIKIIGTSGPAADGSDFEKGWQAARAQQVAVVDEHYYKQPQWFLDNLSRYDNYPRTGPKVYLGEYASWGSTLFHALAEAAYMTGLERNGDVVEFASYAPLLGRIGHTQWNPDLIYFDGQGVYPTVNYHVQRLFSIHRGDIYIDKVFNVNKASAASCVQDSKTGDIILKMVNTDSVSVKTKVNLKAFRNIRPQASLILLKGNKEDRNTREQPTNIIPAEQPFHAGKSFEYELPAYSLSVIRIRTR